MWSISTSYLNELRNANIKNTNITNTLPILADNKDIKDRSSSKIAKII
ncbi:MAG: hypothetical protein ACO2ON_04275 [Candidatus Nanopusillus sp.]|jgi:hypothetical protein